MISTLEEVHKNLAQAAGRLSLAIEVRRTTKRELLEVIEMVEQPLARLKALVR